MKRVALAVALLIALAMPAWADFQAGVDAYSRGDYATALQEFKPLAEQGNADAQSALGSMYYHGQGVAQDYAEAAKWFRKAAKQHFVAAQISLGLMYEDGQGLPQDYREAMKWYRRAATWVNTRAQLSLKAIHFERTRNLDDVMRSYWDQIRDNYGIRSWRSYLVEAYKWFEIIAPVLPSGRERDMIDKTRDDIAEEMTPAQIAEAQRLAREWMEKHGKK